MESWRGDYESATNVYSDNVSRLIGVCMEYDLIILSRVSIRPYNLRWSDVGSSGPCLSILGEILFKMGLINGKSIGFQSKIRSQLPLKTLAK